MDSWTIDKLAINSDFICNKCLVYISETSYWISVCSRQELKLTQRVMTHYVTPWRVSL